MEQEVWKDIEGYEGKYQVSNLGRVKSLSYRHTGREQILETWESHNGYLKVNMYKNGRMLQLYLHRLVAIAFIPNPEGKPEVDHINGKKHDCRACNLRWVTSIENKNNGISKKVLCVETGKEFPSSMEAERQTGAHHSNITKCCQGKHKTAKGFHWRYAD